VHIAAYRKPEAKKKVRKTVNTPLKMLVHVPWQIGVQE
jgi:hypothetical protein